MYNLYQPKKFKILKIKNEPPEVKLFTLKGAIDFTPGQFVLVGIKGFGEGPFAICSSPEEKKFFELCILKIGSLTSVIHKLKKGDTILIRGPYGHGFSRSDKDILLVAGGLGIVPLRSLINYEITKLYENTKRKKRIIVFYGAKTPKDFLFQNEFSFWEKSGVELYLTIDKPCPNWKGQTGLVTSLFDKIPLPDKFSAFLCGPPIMYKFAIEKLKEKNVDDKDIYLSLERRMHCGFGVCQHCAIGSYYVCKDGPVFSWDKIKNIFGAI